MARSCLIRTMDGNSEERNLTLKQILFPHFNEIEERRLVVAPDFRKQWLLVKTIKGTI